MGKQNKHSKQVDKNITKLVRIDAGLHHYVKLEAVKRSTTIRALIEEGLAEVLSIKTN